MRKRAITSIFLIIAGCAAFFAGRVWRSMPTEPIPDSGWAPARSAQAVKASRDRGASAAMLDIKVGKLKLKEYPPLPTPAGYGEYVRLLQARCGVDYEVVKPPAGVNEADFSAEVRGWNEKMTAEIERKFGADILSRLYREAQQRWQKQINLKRSR
jgi:hypothetical protein